ncbi:MAG: hypothetical protein ACXQS3_06645 [Candidatus Methanofastidiosia archaeon]
MIFHKLVSEKKLDKRVDVNSLGFERAEDALKSKIVVVVFLPQWGFRQKRFYLSLAVDYMSLFCFY